MVSSLSALSVPLVCAITNRERATSGAMRMTVFLRRSIFAAITVIGVVTQVATQTATYPAKPIWMIVPFPPGGNVDFVSRLLAPKLSDGLGKQIVIENRSG